MIHRDLGTRARELVGIFRGNVDTEGLGHPPHKHIFVLYIFYFRIRAITEVSALHIY